MAWLLQKRGMTNTDHPIMLLIMTVMCDYVCVYHFVFVWQVPSSECAQVSGGVHK